ncbi:hypothetical protein OsJ_15339 [Oryza sativa Japonica Group]|uniref:Uncharacterized protein n=1 Tax=Oryza sativa subsp. japonica TaxID=39947 RepID=B9FFY0_ORYSJ|nr:hypothetical protein OsJ_15339 [Oryza sativa Japonica Group]
MGPAVEARPAIGTTSAPLRRAKTPVGAAGGHHFLRAQGPPATAGGRTRPPPPLQHQAPASVTCPPPGSVLRRRPPAAFPALARAYRPPPLLGSSPSSAGQEGDGSGQGATAITGSGRRHHRAEGHHRLAAASPIETRVLHRCRSLPLSASVVSPTALARRWGARSCHRGAGSAAPS